MKFTSKPVTVEAERYDLPADHDDFDSVISALSEFAAAPLERQVPWNPAEGQNCLLLRLDPRPSVYNPETGEPTAYYTPVPQLVRPGDYIIRTDADPLVIVGERFVAAYDVPDGARPAKSADKPDWVAYAVTRGADPAEAEAATKADLITKYGA